MGEVQAVGELVRALSAFANLAASYEELQPTSRSWAGVLTCSDWPAHPVRLPWPPNLYETSRVQVAQILVSGFPVLLTNVYGYARSHARAVASTEALLEPITQEIVLGRTGVRVICGDFNASEDDFLQVQMWKQHGWIEIQQLAWERWGTPKVPTCKGTTQRDFIFLSPEAAALCVGSQVSDVFQEHSTVSAQLRIASNAGVLRSWPRPAEIPWQNVALDGLHTQGHVPLPPILDPSMRYQKHAQLFEQSVNGFVDCPGGQLPSACFGRAKLRKPVVKHSPVLAAGASREGEEVLCSDLVSQEVCRWFKQLRRLQSLCQSLGRPRNDFNALEYRGSLWASIWRAKGFQGGFAEWWTKRPLQHCGCPSRLSHIVPSYDVARAVFLDFRDNFRRFENWHVQKRQQVLKARHEASRQQLFRDLRSEPPRPVDVLVNHRAYSVLDVEPQEQLLHVDSPLDFSGTSEWRVSGQPVTIERVADDVCRVQGNAPLEADSELEQLQYVSTTEDVQSEFVRFWTLRWNKTVCPGQWQRILDFTRAFLPRLACPLQPITPAMWRAAIKRFKPRAARGPDGYSRDDLLNMPLPRVQELLNILTDVETSGIWPEQLVNGLVHALDKRNGCESVAGFRPICLFSIVYRTWAGIRARQLLRWLSEISPVGAFGFLQGREATEVWYLLECLVESAVQTSQALSGYGSDLVKAFNNLPRKPLFEASAWLGIPSCVLTPWKSFLSRVERRFVVHGFVSDAITSNCGYPEGCPLSTVAMAVCSFLHHTYMQVFAPSIESLSYVDNLLGISRGAFDVAHGLNVTRCFCEALALELDDSKTYVWSTDSSTRRVLKQLNLKVKDTARELGGVVSFGPATRNKPLVQRCESLAPVFAALARSKAPWSFKVAVLPAKFWSIALHGISGVPASADLLQRLRTQAVRALKAAPAGASPALRLGLSRPMTADPGFYQLWACLTTLRRMCLKQPRVLQQWQSFMVHYDGRLLPGPFSKILTVLNEILWVVGVPPFFLDEEGLQHNMLLLPKQALRCLAERAWLQHLARTHCVRLDMIDLVGLDVSLARLDAASFCPRVAARVSALQSGALMFGDAQSRFDMTQSGLCPMCRVADTKEHRLRFCARFSAQRQPHRAVVALWQHLPRCLTHHLLPPANAHTVQLRSLLHQLPDATLTFVSLPNDTARQHLFTDGACTQYASSELALAAWGVVNASSGSVVAMGQLPGIWQSAPRAELTAVLSAVCWTSRNSATTAIWCDAYRIAEGLRLLLGGTPPDAGWSNLDLWERIWLWVQELRPRQLCVHHVPSHLDPELCEDDFEIWVATWNQYADTVAGLANLNRSGLLSEVHHHAVEYFQATAKHLRSLRALYLAIADASEDEGQRHEGPSPEWDDDISCEDLPLGSARDLAIADQLPVNWQAQLRDRLGTLDWALARSVVEFMLEQVGSQ
ncbi:LINE-1 reverse transcriptase-like [Symbiodinium microadriaticum]|uniref:LINE-1 reverse transcriptase-like n=1 Tax=Symbiodinium microadriaticum TaxID=2951 RepID=A0A1Q9F001_SYMMI|nr:LINE-1 reverse transcriptase-like [Symbiodinium microadriaticum]